MGGFYLGVELHWEGSAHEACAADMTRYIRSNIPLQEFPRASLSGTPSGKGVYLTVYPLSCPTQLFQIPDLQNEANLRYKNFNSAAPNQFLRYNKNKKQF